MSTKPNSQRAPSSRRESSPWRGSAAGPAWGLAILDRMYSVLPVRVAYVTLMPLVLGWYWHFNQPREATVLAMRRLGQRWPHLAALRAYWQFGLLMVDKHYERHGRLTFTLSEADRSRFEDYVVQPGPRVLLGSHCGAMEAGVSLGEGAGRSIRGVVIHDPSTAGIFNPAAGLGKKTSTVVADGTMASGLRMLRVLRDGDILAFKADRVLPGTDAKDIVVLPFLGELAAFPRGPAAIVQAARAEALCLELFRVGPGRFEVVADIVDTRGASADEIAVAYVAALERAVQRRPDQWFNFYPFWPSDRERVAELPPTAPLGLRAMEGSPWAALFMALASWALSPALRLGASALTLLGIAAGASALASVLGLLAGARRHPATGPNARAWAAWLAAIEFTLLGILSLEIPVSTAPLALATIVASFMAWRAPLRRRVALVSALLLAGIALVTG